MTIEDLGRLVRSALEERGAPPSTADELLAAVLSVLSPGAAWLWLQGHNPQLGAVPLDVAALGRMELVRFALQAQLQGVFE